MRVRKPDGRGGAAADQKRALRIEARARRKEAAEAIGGRAARDLIIHFPPELVPRDGAIVAGYAPIAHELDPRPLMADLEMKGARLALPAVRDGGMSFHVWDRDDVLTRDDAGVAAPAADAPRVDPDMVLAPLLAFDRHGGRLGTGGGWYDRALAELRRRKTFQLIGLAFAIQNVDTIPLEPHDVRLGWILTEAGAFRIRV